MPGFASHYLFGQQSLSHLKEDQEYHILSLHPHAYNLGLQGPDIFYYYLPAWLLYDHNAASLIHENSSLQFFIAMRTETLFILHKTLVAILSHSPFT